MQHSPLPSHNRIADAIRNRPEHAVLTIQITGESYRGVKARKPAGKNNEA